VGRNKIGDAMPDLDETRLPVLLEKAPSLVVAMTGMLEKAPGFNLYLHPQVVTARLRIVDSSYLVVTWTSGVGFPQRLSGRTA
jgi:hypothetical protein